MKRREIQRRTHGPLPEYGELLSSIFFTLLSFCGATPSIVKIPKFEQAFQKIDTLNTTLATASAVKC